jgi:hypothetical protein
MEQMINRKWLAFTAVCACASIFQTGVTVAGLIIDHSHIIPLDTICADIVVWLVVGFSVYYGLEPKKKVR